MASFLNISADLFALQKVEVLVSSPINYRRIYWSQNNFPVILGKKEKKHVRK
jgi:hypothetical protein